MITAEQRANCRVQFITHFNERHSYADSARVALEGGCRWIQLRMKNASSDEILAVAKVVGSMCRQYGATFIIDDHVELVAELGADGVHLGKNDMPINQARQILGDKYIIGGTANTIDDIALHQRNGADYIGCGPLRFTSTKQNLSPIIGIDGYATIVAEMRRRGIELPIVAIGGITPNDIAPLQASGVTGIAISSTIINAELPAAQMQLFINQLT